MRLKPSPLLARALLGAVAFMVLTPSHASESPKILNKSRLEALLQKEFEKSRRLISRNDIKTLKSRISNLTHDDTIFLFEFTLSLPGGELPTKRAYYNRKPFLAMIDHAGLLQGNSLQIDYEIETFKPQYGGNSAIIHDKGSAAGRIDDPVSGKPFRFELTQKCRNTVSTHIKPSFRIDSVYCRVKIDYRPEKTEKNAGSPSS